MKAAANGALAFVFDLAINAISSQIGTSIEKMMQKVQHPAQPRCLSGRPTGGRRARRHGRARDSQFCKIIGNSQGVFSDSSSEQGCGTGGSQSSTIKGNSDSTIPAGPYNYTWSMLSQKYPSFDTDFKQYLMSLVGTVIYQPGTSDSKGPNAGPRRSSADHRAARWRQQRQRLCLRHHRQVPQPHADQPIGQHRNALKTRVYNLLIDISARIQGNQQLTSEEIGLLGATTIPLYKIMVVNAAASFGGMNSADISSLAEITSVDLLETIVGQFYKMVTDGQSSFQNADPLTLKQWQDQYPSGQGRTGCQSRPSRNNVFARTMMRRMTAVIATFFAFPAFTNC
jgi:conjugative transfer pilus assembly protein TraH